MSSVDENCFIVTVELTALHGRMMTSWFITEEAENMNAATENSNGEMHIFHCHHIRCFLTTQRMDDDLCILTHFEVISLYMRLLNEKDS